MTDQDITPLLLDALGKRIDDPAARRLAEAIGKKPFKTATLNNDPYLVNRKLGLAVGAQLEIMNRSYFPPRKEGRTWITWVSFAFLYPNYRGSLPSGFDWHMDDAALSERFIRRVEGTIKEVRFTLPVPRDGLTARVVLDSEGRPKDLYLSVAKELPFVTMYPDSNPGHKIEDSFFATWCALNGILREGRLTDGQFDALRNRQLTPLTFLSTTLGGLLWQGDVRQEYAAFCYAYMKRLMDPEKATALSDVTDIFGESNYWREPMTEDSWENFDRIAPRYAERLEQWRRGKIRSTVHWPNE